jgi:hypothetical protein
MISSRLSGPERGEEIRTMAARRPATSSRLSWAELVVRRSPGWRRTGIARTAERWEGEVSGPIVRKYGFPNFEKIFGERPIEHGVEEPESVGAGDQGRAE